MPARRRAASLGGAAETFVAERLGEQGYDVLARNWRCAAGEMDIVAVDRSGRQPVLVFCEVKARHSTAFGDPGEAVDGRKQRRLRGAAAEFLAAGLAPAALECRFDVAEVVVTDGVAEWRHIPDAF